MKVWICVGNLVCWNIKAQLNSVKYSCLRLSSVRFLSCFLVLREGERESFYFSFPFSFLSWCPNGNLMLKLLLICYFLIDVSNLLGLDMYHCICWLVHLD